MKGTRWLGYTSGVLLLLAGGAHAFGGWPPFEAELLRLGLEPSHVGALATGWYFGSAAFLAFAAVVLASVWGLGDGRPGSMAGVWIVAVTLIAFGASAYLVRGLNPHFLGFVALGGLVAAYAALVRRANRR